MIVYRAEPCPCGHRICSSWHVVPAAMIRGVNFDEQQAKDVAAFLNMREMGTSMRVVAAAPDLLAAAKVLLRDMETPPTRKETVAWAALQHVVAEAESR